MDNSTTTTNNKAGGKKKKKRSERKKKSEGEIGSESCVGIISAGEHALDLGEKNPEPGETHGVSLGLPDVSEGLGSQHREGAEADMEEQSDDVENASSVTAGISMNAEAPHRSDDSAGRALDEEEGYKDSKVPVQGQLENAILVIDGVSKEAHASHSSDDSVCPASDKEKGINASQVPVEGELGNADLVIDGLSKDAEASHGSDNSVNPASDEEEYKDSEAQVEEELDNAATLPCCSSDFTENREASSAEGGSIGIDTVQDLASKVNIENSSVFDLFIDGNNFPSSSSTFHEQAHEMLSPKGVNDELAVSETNPSHDFDKLNSELSEDTSQDLGANMEDKIAARQELSSESQFNQVVGSSDLDLQQNQNEEIQGARLVSMDKLSTSFLVGNLQTSFMDSLQFVKDGRNRNMSVDESFVDALDQLTGSRSPSLEESALVIESGLFDKERLLHELNACKDALLQANEEKLQLVSKLNSCQAQVEKLSEEKLHLTVKLQDAANAKPGHGSESESEKAAALPKTKEVQQNVEAESLNEVQGKDCLEAIYERFAKEAKDREDDPIIQKLRSQLQILSDENHNSLLTKLDEHSKNMKKAEHENEVVRKELAELKLILDESNKAKEQITRDYEFYKRETCSVIAEKEEFEAEAVRLRQQTDELNLQIYHLKDELHEVDNEKLKLMGDLDKYKLLVENSESEREELCKDLQMVRAELEQMKIEAEFYKTHEEGRNQLAEKNNKLSAELLDCKKLLSRMQDEKLGRDTHLRDVVLELHNATRESMHLASSLHKHTHLLAEVEGEYLKPIQDAQDDPGLLQNQTELLRRDYIDQGMSLGADPNDCKDTMHHVVKRLEESLQPHDSTSDSDFLNIDSELATAVSATLQILTEFKILQEERVSAVRELTITCDHLKKLVQQHERMSEDGEELLNRLRHADAKEVEGNTQAPMALNILVNDCGKFVIQLQQVLGERSQFEATIRELESALFTKDQDIRDINAKCAELSQKCGQIEEISAKCAALEEKCAHVAYQAAQLASERDSLHVEIDALQKAVLEKEILIKASADSHYDLKCQFDMITEKLIAAVQEVIQDETLVADPCMQRISYLEASLLLLIEKYKISLSEVNLFQKSLFEFASSYGHLWEKETTMPLDVILREVFSYKENELAQSCEKLDGMNLLTSQQETQVRELRDSLCKSEENLKEVKDENGKLRTDLEQTEMKLLSVREKLSMAVSKGKGLVQQRDALKQSLVDKSNELEKCLQELQMKNNALNASEMKAAERIKFLELELAHVQNSASAFQESFSNNDSLLQKIENVLGELNLPNELCSKQILEKIEWLARSSSGEETVALSNIRDREISEADGTNVADYKLPDVSVDGDMIDKRSLDDLKTKFEELQDKYCSLVEQSGMLEQSLSERDLLIQRWENLLNGVDMPTSIQSIEPEPKIEWLCRALNQAQQDVACFQHEIENVQRVADLSTIELEESKRRIISLEQSILKEKQEKEVFVKNLEEISCKYENLTLEAAQYASQKESSCNELVVDQKVEVLDHESPPVSSIVDKSSVAEDCMRRLVDIVSTTMKEQDFEELTSYYSNEEHLEGCLRKLIDKLNALSEEVEELKETTNTKTEELQSLQAVLDTTKLTLMEMNKKQEETYSTVASHKAEIHSLTEQNRIMNEELVTVKDQKDTLKVQLEEAEERSSLIREKLSMAVKKGKGLVQQRDSLKQSVDEKVAELEHLRAELQVRDSAINELEEKIRNLCSELERFEIQEIDIVSSRNRCTDLEKMLRDSNSMMRRLTNSIDDIDFPAEVISGDPTEKIEWLGKSVNQLHQKINFVEEEAKKCNGEADILATKLDEACQNVRILEDELRDAENKISILTNEKKAAETESNREIQVLKDMLTARTEALNDADIRVDCQISELSKQQTLLNNLRKEHSCLLSLLASDFLKKLDLLRNMELSFQDILSQLDALKGSKFHSAEVSSEQISTIMKLYQEGKYLANDEIVETYREEQVDHLLHDNDLHSGQIVDELMSYLKHTLDGCTGQLEHLKERFIVYCDAIDQGATVVSRLLQYTRGDVVTLVESLKSLKQNVASVEALNKDKDNRILMLHENIITLFNGCKNSMEELQKLKVQIFSNSLSSSEEGTTLGSTFSALENFCSMQLTGQVDFITAGECVKTAENLLFTIRDVANAVNENSKQNQREVISLRSKYQQADSMDAEKLKTCKELENRLMKAEAFANDLAREKNDDKARISELESHIAYLENDCRALELTTKEFQTREASMKAMQDELASLNDALSTKTQALENLYKKVEELEDDCHQKQELLGSLESSHGKSLAELSDTCSRFEELRQLSERLIAEVENLNLQLESRDEEITWLKEEARKSTYDIPSLLENIEKKNREIGDLQVGLEKIITKLGVDHMLLEQKEESRMQTMLYNLEKRISAIMSESESSRVDAENKDVLLQNSQNSVEELSGKVEMLEAFLREKQTQFEIFRLEKHPQPGVTAAEVSEIEEVGQSSKSSLSSVPIAPHVRNTRKASSNHLALDIDMDSDKSSLHSEDHDKGHAFKSLTTTGLIPKSTQSVADWIDGIWVSGGRILMRQPTARMGLIVYWIVLHIWMVATVL